MNRMIAGLQNLLRKVWDVPPPDPMVEEAKQRTKESIKQSRDVGGRADAFSNMVRGMRGESRGSSSGRPRRRKG